VINEVVPERGDCAACDDEMDDLLGQPHDQHAQPVDRALEQDGLDHWRAIEAAHKGQVVGYQNGFSDEQRRYYRGEEATELHALLLQDQAFGQ
jgi:hypothetical protein